MPKLKRFSRYNFALKLTTPSAGSNLEKYKNWKSGATPVTYTRADTSNPGSYNQIYLFPFGLDDAGDKYGTVASKRAMDAIDNTLGGATTLNHKTLAANEAPILAVWEPAKAHIHKKGTGDGSTKTSKLTGKQYKAKAGAAAYVYPFGRNASGDSLLARYEAIRQAAKVKNCSVSFTPERFYDA